MGSSLKKIAREVTRTIQHPGRLRNLFNRRLLHWKIASLREQEGQWTSTGPSGVTARSYGRYESYVRHQKSKLRLLDLSEYDKTYRAVLLQRLKEGGRVRPGSNVICLAARIGTEVRAFQDVGCFAVGIDLNPGKDNALVLPGDFHHIQFPNDSADHVFTNSLDHAFDLVKVIREMRRVLKPGGVAIVEAVNGTNEGGKPGIYESTYWSSISDLVTLFTAESFSVVYKAPFNDPWKGEHLYFQKP